MKYIYRTLLLLLIISLASCSDNQGTFYNGNLDEFTFLTTDGTSYDLQIIRDSTGVLTIPFKASTLSSNDRTYTIELIQPTEGVVVADPATYNLPTSVTIPANQWIGDLVITGQDLGLVDLEAKPFSFRIAGLNDKEFMDDDTINVGVVEVCILGENATFTGDYMVTSVVNSSYFGQIGPEFAEGSVVTLTGEGFIRTFTANYYPGFWNISVDFSFNLQCGNIWVYDFDTGAYCSSPSTIKILKGDVPGSYNAENDSEIIVTFSADYGSCASNSPQQVTFKLTKQ